MRVNQKELSKCQECGIRWKNTKEMYDIQICDSKFTLCFDCIDKIFHKVLKADCMYNSKVKSQEDLERVRNYNAIKNPTTNKDSVEMPFCYGDFLKQKKCKKCQYLYECKQTYIESKED